MARPDLSKVIKMLEAGEDFSLTDKQYLKKTGLSIPKNPSYLISESAVAKEARKNGFSVTLQERTIIFKSTTFLLS